MNLLYFFKRNCVLLCLLVWITGRVQAGEPRNLLQQQGDVNFVKKVLLAKEKWMPYPAYRDRNAWNLFLGDYKQELIQEGEKYLTYQWLIVKATDYLEYSRSGSRTIMEEPFNKNLKAISTLFLAEMAEGNKRFMDQLINGVFALCEMTTWSLSAHLSLQQGNNKRFPDHQQNIIDLFVGDVGSMLSWIHYFLKEEFDKENKLISERIRFEIKKRVLDPYMETDRFWWMGFSTNPSQLVNNWNVWCNSNVLQTFALMEEDQEKLAQAVYKTMRSVDRFINYVHEDGACEEGPSYWGHAAGKLYDYLQFLHNITGGQISIFHEPLIKNMGEYICRSYVGNGWVVNFADATARGGGDAALIYRYGKAVNSKEMTTFASYLIKEGRDNLKPKEFRDVFRILESIAHNKEVINTAPSLPTASYTWYPQTEFLYVKNVHYFLAAKGGHNNESHNHNDVGTFSLYVDTIPFFVDAGVGTYMRQTFGSERYSIWTMQSNYHNLPTINGFAQLNGANYKSSDARFDNRYNRFSLDISKAYPKEAAVKTWYRTYTLSSKELKIEDAFELTTTKQPHIINFLVAAKPDTVKKGIISLRKEGKEVILHYPYQQFDVEVDTIELTDKKLSSVWGKELYRIKLVAKSTHIKGKYVYTIQKNK